MPVSPATALAVPGAAVAAVKLSQRVIENRPFASFLENLRDPGDAAGEAASASDAAECAGEPFDRRLQAFAARVQQRLRAAGLRTSIRFELTADAGGSLRVNGSHPKRDRIERLLAEDEQLSREFAELAEQYTQPSQRQAPHDFAQRYVRDGVGAGDRPPEQAPPRFCILINGEGASVP